MQTDQTRQTKRCRQTVLLFTRYPQAGKVKTRLIDRLGPQGAAELQSRMTEQVLQQIRPPLRSEANDAVQLQIYYNGGSEQEMRDWLGPDLPFFRQQGNSLGERMAAAFVYAWNQGAEQVLLIGSDCPSIDAAIITTGLEKLHSHDLVLGPATDGGYYLIGLRAFSPQYEHLFREIDWGTEQVLRQTLDRAAEADLSFALLPILHDIDRPEDLVHLVHFHYHPGSE
ncbi:MAG: TIGR04282 family arsenosugar biosynthesis glycosyltransferase [Candidatus Electrothrix sp. YB6]